MLSSLIITLSMNLSHTHSLSLSLSLSHVCSLWVLWCWSSGLTDDWNNKTKSRMLLIIFSFYFLNIFMFFLHFFCTFYSLRIFISDRIYGPFSFYWIVCILILHAWVYVYIYRFVYVSVSIYEYMCVHMCVCIYIYIYVYILPVKSIWQSSKIFLILILLFWMKQVKNHNGFIYYTKYKSLWATLNTNKNKIKSKKRLNFWFIKMTSFGHYHCFTDSWHSFHQKLEIDLR